MDSSAAMWSLQKHRNDILLLVSSSTGSQESQDKLNPSWKRVEELTSSKFIPKDFYRELLEIRARGILVWFKDILLVLLFLVRAEVGLWC